MRRTASHYTRNGLRAAFAAVAALTALTTAGAAANTSSPALFLSASAPAGNENAEPQAPNAPLAPAQDASASHGTHEVTVVLATARGEKRDSTTTQKVADLVDGPVNDYWQEISGGAISFKTTKQVDWLSLNAPCSDLTNLRKEVLKHLDPDLAISDLSAATKKNVLVYMPSSATCNQSGRGYVGYGFAYITYVDAPYIAAHELGHNVGLHHSSSITCEDGNYSGTVISPSKPHCQFTEYGSPYDIMGRAPSASAGALDPSHALALKVPGFTAADGTPGQHTISSLGTKTTAPRALRVTTVEDGRDMTYYVSLRGTEGADIHLNENGWGNYATLGVTVTKVDSRTPERSVLLDTTPGSKKRAKEDAWDGTLPPNTAFTLGDGTTTITVNSADNTTATITVAGPKQAATVDVPAAAGIPTPAPTPAQKKAHIVTPTPESDTTTPVGRQHKQASPVKIGLRIRL